MTRRSWIFLLILAVLITFGIVFALNSSSSADVNQEAASPSTIVSQNDTSPTQPTNEGVKLETPSVPEKPAAAEVPARSASEVTGTTHFVDCAFRTGGNATIGIPLNINLEGGLTLEPGDEIAIFTSNGAVCAGTGVWTGNNIAITAWGDSSETEDTIDGLQEGEEMHFRIWDESAGDEIEVTAVTYELGDGVYTVDGIFVVKSFK